MQNMTSKLKRLMEATLVSCNIKSTDSEKNGLSGNSAIFRLKTLHSCGCKFVQKPFAQTLFQIKHNPHGSGAA